MTLNLGGITSLSGLSIGAGEAIVNPAAFGSGNLSSAASAGRGLVWNSYRTFPVVALTLTANGSTITTNAFPGAATGDACFCHPTSSMSSGGVLAAAYVSAPNVVTLVYSNASTVALTIVTQPVGVEVRRYTVS